MEKFKIKDDYITVGQFLKLKDYVSSGGEAKAFLLSAHIYLNNEQVTQRGKKMFAGDQLVINDKKYLMI